MCLNGDGLIGHLVDPIVSTSGVDPGFTKHEGGTMGGSETTELGEVVGGGLVPLLQCRDFLVNLRGAYAIPVELSGIGRMSCVICVHHN